MCHQDKTEANAPTTIFLEFLQKMQSTDLDAPLDPPMEVLCIDDEFSYLVSQIDEYMRYFLRLQKTMTTVLEKYQRYLLVGMQIYMRGRVVHVAEDTGLIVPQQVFIQHHFPNLWLM